MITWNIDGLEEKSLRKRTQAVINTIREVSADIVFLQEVIPETYSYIQSHLADHYECIAAKGSRQNWKKKCGIFHTWS